MVINPLICHRPDSSIEVGGVALVEVPDDLAAVQRQDYYGVSRV